MDNLTKLILPFAVPAADRSRAFTKDIERAAVFYIAESEREKGERRILKKPAEELVFIAEVCYPIWLFPWRGRNLLFDGLGVMKHTLCYDRLPDVKAFHATLQESAKTRESYSAALSYNANYFQVFIGREEETLEGLITSPVLIKSLVSLFEEAEEIEKPIVDKALLSPIVDESDILSSIEELSNFRAKLRKDINDLRESMKLLNATSRRQVKVIREEIKETKKEFDEEIAKVKPKIAERVQGIERKCHTEITKVSKKFDRRLQLLYEDRVKLEKKQKRFNLQIERYKTEMRSCRLRGDDAGELGWKLKFEKTKKELPVLKKDLKDLSKKAVDAETAKKLKITRLQSECDVSIEKAMKDLRELEASLEARIEIKRQERKSLKDVTSAIITQMDEKVGSKKDMLKELEGMGTPKSRKNYVLVYLPFYLTCYETKKKKRYVVYPPSVVGSMGILTKLKSALGATKIKSFLHSRSRSVTTLINQLLPMIKENPVFEKEISDAGIQVNILKEKYSRELIKKGLRELKEEKWISKIELQTCNKFL